MRIVFRGSVFALAGTFVLAGCAAWEQQSRATKGAVYGAGAGAAAGSAVGAVVGGGEGAWKGAAIGAVLGTLTGGAIGHYMDRQAAEMERILAEQDRIRREHQRIDIALASDLLFDSGKAYLQPGARDKIRNLAAVLNRYPETTVEVIGHTDSRGSDDSNYDLSRRRAEAVANELVSNGVSHSRIQVRGDGESNPVASNETPEGRQLNRRVEIRVTPNERSGAEEPG